MYSNFAGTLCPRVRGRHKGCPMEYSLNSSLLTGSIMKAHFPIHRTVLRYWNSCFIITRRRRWSKVITSHSPFVSVFLKFVVVKQFIWIQKLFSVRRSIISYKKNCAVIYNDNCCRWSKESTNPVFVVLTTPNINMNVLRWGIKISYWHTKFSKSDHNDCFRLHITSHWRHSLNIFTSKILNIHTCFKII